MGIDAGVVQHQIGVHLIEQIRHQVADAAQVVVILQSVVESEVDIAVLLVQREVAAAVR